MQTDEFLKLFPGYCLQTFDDKAKNRSFAMCGTPTPERWKRARALNKKSAGVFFTPNSCPDGKRKKENMTQVNAWFVEMDDFPLKEQWDRFRMAPLRPSVIIKTRKSLHGYYLAKNGAKLENFPDIQKSIIQYFDGDPACKDISRVLRVPGYYHNKQDPLMVTIVWPKNNSELKYYTEAEMVRAFPLKKSPDKPIAPLSKPNKGQGFWDAAASLSNKLVLQRASGTAIVNHEMFTFRPRSGGGEHIDVNGKPADAWIDSNGMIGSGKDGGPTYIQWFQYYDHSKGEIAKWIKENCRDLLPKSALNQKTGLSNEKKDDTSTQTETLIELFDKQNPIIFRDQMDDPFTQFSIGDQKHIKRCESKSFGKYLHHLYWKETSDLVNSENLTKVMNLIAAKAIYGDQQFKLQNRVAYCDGDVWYDIGHSKAVRIRKGTWEIVNDIPILFRSFQHQEDQILPVAQGEGDALRLLNHIHLQSDNHKVLLLVWLVASYIPEIAHAILVLFGGQGSAKSTTMRFLRQLIDPSKAGLLSLPSADEIVQQLAHHYTPFYDNVNRVNQNTSDILCRAVTGAGASKRRLFTDDDDVIYQYRRVIALNGINNVVENPDLHDRSIMTECKRIDKEQRKTEEIVNTEFATDRPIILGGIFDVLAQARVEFDHISLNELPRMADFAKWGYAIAEILGFGGPSFLKAYESNINQQNEEVLENDPVAHTICRLIDDYEEWEGTPTELHEKLFKIAEDAKVNLKAMPKTPATLGRQINVVHSNLLESGIVIEKEKDKTRRGRFYKIYKQTVSSVSSVAKPDTTPPENDDCDSSDDKNALLNKISNKEIKEVFGPETEIDDIPNNS